MSVSLAQTLKALNKVIFLVVILLTCYVCVNQFVYYPVKPYIKEFVV